MLKQSTFWGGIFCLLSVCLMAGFVLDFRHIRKYAGVCQSTVEINKSLFVIICVASCWRLVPETADTYRRLPTFAGVCPSLPEWRFTRGLIIRADICRRMNAYVRECRWLPEIIVLCDQTRQNGRPKMKVMRYVWLGVWQEDKLFVSL